MKRAPLLPPELVREVSGRSRASQRAQIVRNVVGRALPHRLLQIPTCGPRPTPDHDDVCRRALFAGILLIPRPAVQSDAFGLRPRNHWTQREFVLKDNPRG